MGTNTGAIIEDVKYCYDTILELCHGVPEEMLVAPTLPNGWSVKDTLAHIAAWDWRCAALLKESLHTNAPLKARPDVDALNREILEERRSWRWNEVVRDFQAAHQALVMAIQDLPPERLNDTVIQESIAEETCEHYGQHIPDLEQWRKQIVGDEVARGR